MADDEAEDVVVEDVAIDGCCSCSIQNLPAEILELILRRVSPYEDLKNCRLVCRHWDKLVTDVVRWRMTGFVRDIRTMNVRWHHQPASPGPSIVARYGHGCCRHSNSMFVFGGCTGRNTTFNDLWRFDLSSRRWIRPLAVGTYPPPMAFSTFVSYGGILILFGGLTYPSPSAMHQFHNYRLYNTLHFYEIQANQWSELTTISGPPPTAGHSASVHGHLMVVFGGRQFVNGRYQGKCNDLWVLNLKTVAWSKQTTNDPKPPPMLNQTQVAIDDHHLLIIDGCGGPNMILSDMWLLRIEREPDMPWTWTKMAVLNQQHAATNLWYHPACKVEDKLVFLGRGPRSMSPVSTSMMNQVIQIAPRVWIPPHEEDMPLLRVVDDDHHNVRHCNDQPQNGVGRADEEVKAKCDVELCVNGKRGVLPVRNYHPPRLSGADDSAGSSTSGSSPSSSTSTPKVSSDADEASCSYNCSESEKLSTGDNSADDGPSVSNKCSLCGNAKLHSLKRRRRSSNGGTAEESAKDEGADDERVDDELATDWCHCSTTSAGGQSSSLNVSGFKLDPAVISTPPLAAANSPMVVRNSAMPSVRPNSLKNRVRQMESFQRMEQRIRNMMRPPGVPPQPPLPQPPIPPVGNLQQQHEQQQQPNVENGAIAANPYIAPSARQPMLVHVLDISGAVERGVLEWLPLQDQSSSDGPEDTGFFSLVKGRGEIIMFGGIQRDQNCKLQGAFFGRNTVSNQVRILSSK